MYIEKLNITAFGRLNDFELSFEPGVNIIEGANESGKSTLAAFIKFMFYGLSPKERPAVIGWDSSAAAGTLTFRTDTHRYRIERAIRVSGSEEKPTYREAVQLVDLSNNMPCHKGESPGELFFGVDSEMFAATAFVSQLGGTNVGGAKVSDGIENLLFSADETVNTQRALERLDSARVLLLHKNGKGGKIFELSNEIAELETRLDAAMKASSELQIKESKLADYREKEASDREKSELLNAKLRAFEAKTLAGLFERMHALERRISELDEKLASSASPEASRLEQLRAAKIKLGQLQAQLDSLKTDNESLPPSEQLERFKARGRREGIEAEKTALGGAARSNTAVGIILAVFAAAALGFAGLSLGLSILEIASSFAAASAIVGAVLLALSIVMLVSASKKRRELSQLDEEFDIPALEAEIAERSAADERAKLNEAMRNGLLSQLDDAIAALNREFSVTPEELDDRIAQLEIAAASTEKLRTEREKYLGMLSQMHRQLDGYDENEIAAESSSTLDLSDIDAANLTAMRREAEFLTNSAKTLAGFTANLEREIAAIHLTDDPAKLESRLRAARAERDKLEKQLAALKLASEKLSEASASLRDSFAPRLAAEASRLLGRLTADKYSEVGVGGELSMSCRTKAGQKSISALSAGTQDAAYLALRLALCRLIYRRELPPMIFDESFSRMDDDRTRAMLRLLTAEPQSLVLTANSRERSLAADHNYLKI